MFTNRQCSMSLEMWSGCLTRSAHVILSADCISEPYFILHCSPQEPLV